MSKYRKNLAADGNIIGVLIVPLVWERREASRLMPDCKSRNGVADVNSRDISYQPGCKCL
jgi:hypothetical protein